MARDSEYQRKYYKLNCAHIIKQTTKYQQSHPIKRLLIAARSRAKAAGVAFSLTEADVMVPACCPILGQPLAWGSRNADNSPSLDRIVPAKGYVKGNIQVISRRANTLKRDATPEELGKVADYMRALCLS